MTWVPFHASLREGDKRGLPRSVRFVYLELSLLSRPTGGRLVLPRGFRTDIDAIHDILGGDRREIKLALELLTVPFDPSDPSDEPMLRLVGPPERRVLELPSHQRWVAADTSADRMRRLRERRRESSRPPASGCDVTSAEQSSPSVTHQRREEERREEKITPVAPMGGTDDRAAKPATVGPEALTVGEAKPAAEKRAKAPRATRLPDGWKPSEAVLAWAAREGIRNPLGPLEEFADYWRGIPGQRGTKVDWDGTYRNRLRQLVEDGRLEQRRPAQTPPPPSSVTVAKADPMTPEERETARREAMRMLDESMPSLFRDVMGGTQ